ncbi:hypothetical protein Q3G72_027805 [Acer saccharum]|nr:hypothetical protein Q3G72_027805 [Acer saccharum]
MTRTKQALVCHASSLRGGVDRSASGRIAAAIRPPETAAQHQKKVVMTAANDAGTLEKQIRRPIGKKSGFLFCEIWVFNLDEED